MYPDAFVPERWSSKKEMTKDASIFAPFSTGKPTTQMWFGSILMILGRYSCIGKQLGLMEVRHVTAQIVRKYDVELAPGQTPEAFLDGKKDAFTLALGPLQLVFRAREKHGGA